MRDDLNNKPVTIRDIAAVVKVHHATVSRALRDDPRISKETREKIQTMARKMGYRANPYVTALTTQMRSRHATPGRATIGVLNTFGHSGWAEKYEEGIAARAAEHGFAVDVICTPALAGGIHKAGRIIRARGIRGLIVEPVNRQPEFDGIDFSSLACATIDLSLRKPALHRACADYFQGMRLALDMLHAKHYERIAFCSDTSEIHRIIGTRWLGGYLAWHAQSTTESKIVPHISNTQAPNGSTASERDRHWRNCREAFERWLDREKPDAIISNNFFFEIWLQELGRKVPIDIAFAALGLDLAETGRSGISQRPRQIGAAAVDLVAGQIYRNEYGIPPIPTTVLVPPVWIDGVTTR